MAETLIGVEKCGGCARGKVVDAANLLQRECWGGPPTPCLIVTGQAPNGAVSFRVEMVRPRVQATDDGCALFKRRTETAAALTPAANARSL